LETKSRDWDKNTELFDAYKGKKKYVCTEEARGDDRVRLVSVL